MKTLLAALLTLALIIGTLATVSAQGCDPATDPTCHQQCPRDSVCDCTWEPDCPTPTPFPGKPPRTAETHSEYPQIRMPQWFTGLHSLIPRN